MLWEYVVVMVALWQTVIAACQALVTHLYAQQPYEGGR